MPIQDAPPYDYIESGYPTIPQDEFELQLLQNADRPGTRTIAYGGVPDATQYQQELQRAQAGSGFIAPNVSSTGEVISPGYDPALDQLRQGKAQEAAMRYEGQRRYHSLIAGGATPAEAYRATGHYLNYSNPLAQVKLDAMLQNRQPLGPEVRTVDGVKMIRSGPHSWSRVPEVRPPAAAPVRLPPDVAVQQKNLQGEITDTRRALAKATELANSGSTEDARRVLAYRDQLAELEKQAVVNSTNWMAPKASGLVNPAAPTPAKVITKEIAQELLRAAGGDKNKARKMAQEAGYSL